MATSRELRQKQGELVARSREIINLAQTEQRKRSAEEEAELKRLDKELDDLDPEIERVTKLEARESALAQPQSRAIKMDPNGNPVADSDEEERALIKSFRDRFGLTGQNIASRIPGNGMATRAYRKAFDKWLVAAKGSSDKTLTAEEKRSLSVGTASEGGYTVPQEEFVAELIKTMDNESVIRGLSRTFQIPQAMSLGAPTLSADPADPDWTTELATGSEDSTMAFGKRQMVPNPIAKRLKVSDKLLRASPLGMATIVQERLSYKLAVAHSTAFNTGDGVNKPLGLYVASASGIDTDRDADVSSSNAYVADGFIDARYKLRSGYWPNARWHFHRNFLAQIRKLKQSSTNDYLWQPGMTVGAPNIFLDFPYSVDEYAPSTVTGITGQYVAILGDFSNYWIVDALGMTIQRLDELYAESNQVGFIIRAESDGQPVLSDAFVRCKATIS